MTAAHKFTDEWLLRAMLKIPSVSVEAVEKLRTQGEPYLAQALVRAGTATGEAVAGAVLENYGVSYLDVSASMIEKGALSLIPERVCRKHHLIPVRVNDEDIVVAMAFPLDQEALADVQAASGRRPRPSYFLLEKIDALLAEIFSPDSLINGLVDRLAEESAVEVVSGTRADADDNTPEMVRAPVIRLVNSIISKAVKMRASDIHIEHEERSSAVRFRIDGMLKNVMTLPRSIATMALVSRIKIMSDLDLTEHRKPQDGRAKLRVSGIEIGLRVSTLPTSFGQKVVMRILDKRAAEVPFEKLGFKPELTAKIDSLLRAAQGIFLVTGPTGSGKTTTLYSILNKLKAEDTNIVTAEDPIEYKLQGINQVQVNEKAGLNFAAVLRSVLRQDPDIILVGEIRDQETADIAFQAALTGHLVLSTLHTNDTISTVARLADMGVERFKIAPGLIAITAQRLVRRLCACKAELPRDKANPASWDILKAHGMPARQFGPRGCEHCDFTGYKGRLSIIELLEITPSFKERIVEGADENSLRQNAASSGALYTLAADAAHHIAEGHISFDDVLPYIHVQEKTLGDATPPAAVPSDRTQAAAAPPAPPAASHAPPSASLAAAPVPPASSPSPSPSSSGPARTRVLVVDDEVANRFIARKLLEQQGYEVAEAADGLQCLDAITHKVPDLLLLDLMMPNLDGYGVLKAVRQTLGLADLPVIIITTRIEDSCQEEAFNIGADDYITKPFKPAILAARLKAALRRKSL